MWGNSCYVGFLIVSYKKTLPKTPDSTLNEDYAAPINKQEKDLLDNWVKGEWIDRNLAAEIKVMLLINQLC